MTFSSFHDPMHLYFITASIVEWKQLFIAHEYTSIPLNTFTWMQEQKRILLFAFVIMPTHLHAVTKPESAPIGDILQQFGSFTAHEILKRSQENHQKELLDVFHQARRDDRHEHSIWQDIQRRIFIQSIFYGRRWSIFIKTQLQKIGIWRKIGRTTFIPVQDIMTMEENPLFQLLI